MKKLITLTLLVTLNISFAQNLQEIETELLLLFRQIKVYPTDSLDIKNATFQEKLLEYTSKIPETINYPFDSLRLESLHITTSKDRKFRIYSWNTSMGGSMHDYREIYQYITRDTVTSRIPTFINGYNGSWYSNIYTLKTITDTFYLPHFHYNLNSKENIEGVANVKIENDTLNQTIDLFEYFNDDDITTEQFKKTAHSYIYVEYDYFSVVDKHTMRLIKYDDSKQTIKLPVIIDYGQVTDKFTTYQFNGKYFKMLE